MARHYKAETKTVTRQAYDGMTCDVCQAREEDSICIGRFEMGMNIGEEGEFLIHADICYACTEEEVGDAIHAALQRLHDLIPHGSFRTSFGEWETTGEFLDE